VALDRRRELRQAAVLQNRYVFERLLPAGYDLDTMTVEERLMLAHATPIFDPSRLRNAQQMLASEGVLATIFYRIASSEELGAAYREPGFYRAFLARDAPKGARPEELFTPLENVMLKHLWVWRTLDGEGEGDSGRCWCATWRPGRRRSPPTASPWSACSWEPRWRAPSTRERASCSSR
jgi:hypothetical protein